MTRKASANDHFLQPPFTVKGSSSPLQFSEDQATLGGEPAECYFDEHHHLPLVQPTQP